MKNISIKILWEHLVDFPKQVMKNWNNFPEGMEILVSRRIPNEKDSKDDNIKVSAVSPGGIDENSLRRFRISWVLSPHDGAYSTFDSILREYEKRSTEISAASDRIRVAADMAYLSIGALFVYEDHSLIRAEASMTPKNEKSLDVLDRKTKELNAALQDVLGKQRKIFSFFEKHNVPAKQDAEKEPGIKVPDNYSLKDETSENVRSWEKWNDEPDISRAANIYADEVSRKPMERSTLSDAWWSGVYYAARGIGLETSNIPVELRDELSGKAVDYLRNGKKTPDRESVMDVFRTGAELFRKLKQEKQEKGLGR